MDQFSTDVDSGLSKPNKTLPSKYFYDKIGNELFVRIMHLPEYYLFNAEFEIFSTQTPNIVDALNIRKEDHFEVIELGAGDGTKTLELLKYLTNNNFRFKYLPIDISQDALDDLDVLLKVELPDLSSKTQQGDYFEVLQSLKSTKSKKVVLFLGSNLGNLNDGRATDFLAKLSERLSPNDVLLLGVDLIKRKEIVLPAYDDSQGVTSNFNLNLLTRINRELGGNFDTAKFKHMATYEETEGIIKSYLVSMERHDVFIEKLDKTYHFTEGERIWTEISRKYNDVIIEQIISKSQFAIQEKLTDSKGYFSDYVLLNNAK